MKKRFSLFIIASLSISLSALAQTNDFKVGGLYYSVLSEDNKTVYMENGDKQMVPALPQAPAKAAGEIVMGNSFDDYTGDYCEGAVVVPSTIEYDGVTYTVTELADGAFSRCARMTSITLPETIKVIGPGAFYVCTGLEEIVFPNSVESIDSFVCQSCTGLKKVVWSDAATTIPDHAFGRYVYDTTKADELVIENIDKVTAIGDYAFNDAPLKHYPAWGSLKSIGECAFYGSELEEVSIPAGCVFDEQAFNNCSRLKTLVLPEDCPENVSEYFKGCNAIEAISIAAVTPPALNADWAQAVAPGCVLEVPEESVELYRSAEYWKNFSEIISSGVEVISAEGLTVESGRGRLSFSSRQEAKVFDLQGSLLYSGTHGDLQLAAGIYIVKRGNRSVKVLVK